MNHQKQLTSAETVMILYINELRFHIRRLIDAYGQNSPQMITVIMVIRFMSLNTSNKDWPLIILKTRYISGFFECLRMVNKHFEQFIFIF